MEFFNIIANGKIRGEPSFWEETVFNLRLQLDLTKKELEAAKREIERLKGKGSEE